MYTISSERGVVLFRLLLLFIAVPLIELMLLFRIGARIGPYQTIGLILLTGIVGAWLARREGFRTLAQIQRDLARGVMPGEAMLQGAMILVAGALLVTPGVLTDLLGFSVLFPPMRSLYSRYLIRYFRGRIQVMPTDFPPESPGRRHVDARVIPPNEEPED